MCAFQFCSFISKPFIILTEDILKENCVTAPSSVYLMLLLFSFDFLIGLGVSSLNIMSHVSPILQHFIINNISQTGNAKKNRNGRRMKVLRNSKSG